jgi:enamine deaminase RidA (YjgF/YER057c/UK114 family)
VTRRDSKRGDIFHRWPFFLPDGRHFVFLITGRADGGLTADVYVGSLDSDETRLLLRAEDPQALSTPQTFTHVVKAGKLVFIAGQVGAGPDGKLAGQGMKEQLDQVLKNLTIALKSQGADFSHVAKITIFVTSIEEFRAPEAREVRERHFGRHKPASTLVQIARLANPEYKVEIEAIAVLP